MWGVYMWTAGSWCSTGGQILRWATGAVVRTEKVPVLKRLVLIYLG